MVREGTLLHSEDFRRKLRFYIRVLYTMCFNNPVVDWLTVNPSLSIVIYNVHLHIHF